QALQQAGQWGLQRLGGSLVGHDRAAPAPALDESRSSEIIQRSFRRHTRHTERTGQVEFRRQFRVRREFTTEYVITQDGEHLVVERDGPIGIQQALHRRGPQPVSHLYAHIASPIRPNVITISYTSGTGHQWCLPRYQLATPCHMTHGTPRMVAPGLDFADRLARAGARSAVRRPMLRPKALQRCKVAPLAV